MRKKYIMLLLTIALLTGGCAASRIKTPEAAEERRYAQLEAQSELDPQGIKIIHMTQVLHTGDVGSLTIQGQPNVRYTIVSNFKKRRQTISENIRAYVSKNADKDGKVTWNWEVGMDTEPGTYRIAISGGGKTIKTTYTVILSK